MLDSMEILFEFVLSVFVGEDVYESVLLCLCRFRFFKQTQMMRVSPTVIPDTVIAMVTTVPIENPSKFRSR